MSIMTRIADVDHAISALDGFLRDHDYTAESRRHIALHVRQLGTLEGTAPRYLDREHYETAEAVFCEALPAVPQSSPDWDVEGYWTPSDDGMAFPAHEHSLADRRRWQHQTNLAERSFNTPAE